MHMMHMQDRLPEEVFDGIYKVLCPDDDDKGGALLSSYYVGAAP